MFKKLKLYEVCFMITIEWKWNQQQKENWQICETKQYSLKNNRSKKKNQCKHYKILSDEQEQNHNIPELIQCNKNSSVRNV